MSSDRIDHAAEARREASIAINDPGLTAQEAEMRLRYANVQATLALVEQQRIANLMAYIEVEDDLGVLFKRNLYFSQVREALGLARGSGGFRLA